jgi:DNA-binding NtrC family response regulator
MEQSLAGRKILLVEDNERLRKILVRSLEVLGCNVAQAQDARSAMAALVDGVDCELLLTDLRMPGDIDGVELAHRVTRLRPGIRVLLQTGYYENFAADYAVLQKPFTLDQLFAALQSVLGAQR